MPQDQTEAPREGTLLLDRAHLRLRLCRHGPMLYNPRDIYIGGSFDAYGEFSEGETLLFRQILQPGMVALDVGANIGAHTVAMAQMVGPAGRVHAYEPQRIVHQMLCANIALNGLTNVVAHWAAATRRPDVLRVPEIDYAAGGNFGGLALGGWDRGELVDGRPIDSLALPACHLLKVDVEGMEAEVLAGADATIRQFRPILYVENDRAANSRVLLEAIMALGYRCWWHTPRLFSPQNFFGEAEDRFPRVVSINVLAVPAERKMNVTEMREITDPGEAWNGAS
jgi:FkbM family methyltransferase